MKKITSGKPTLRALEDDMLKLAVGRGIEDNVDPFRGRGGSVHFG